MIGRTINRIVFLMVVLTIAGCFGKRKYDKGESVGETTNQAVNPLMDGDADAEENPLTIKEVKTDDDFVARVGAGSQAERDSVGKVGPGKIR